jgi:hypothetical protein
MVKKDVVQVKNPKSGHYVKIDRAAGIKTFQLQERGVHDTLQTS